MNLTPKEFQLIQTITTFGHFAIRRHVEFIWPDISTRWANQMLKNLADKGYLSVISCFGGYDTYIYRITHKARTLFGVPSGGSNNISTIRRQLILTHFLYQAVGYDFYEPVSTEIKRQAYLRKLGIEVIKDGEPTIVLTEPFIQCEPYVQSGGVCIALYDHDFFEASARPYKLLLRFVEKYKPLRKCIPISFVVPVETHERGRIISATYSSPRWFKDVPPLTIYITNSRYNLFTLTEQNYR